MALIGGFFFLQPNLSLLGLKTHYMFKNQLNQTHMGLVGSVGCACMFHAL